MEKALVVLVPGPVPNLVITNLPIEICAIRFLNTHNFMLKNR